MSSVPLPTSPPETRIIRRAMKYAAAAILAKSMSEERLRQVAEIITAKKVSMTLDEARDLAKRALRFKAEKDRLPSLTATDPWEKRMAEGIAFLQREARASKNG